MRGHRYSYWGPLPRTPGPLVVRVLLLGAIASLAGRAAGQCTESCAHSDDAFCDDGGPGAQGSRCPIGSDCADCGARSPMELPLPTSPSDISFPVERHPRQALTLSVRGACQIAGGCVRSPGYPSSEYGNDESCTISGVPPIPTQVTAFNVEKAFDCRSDHLTIDGARFCGSSGPHGVRAAGGTITWTSDSVTTGAGWELCWHSVPASSKPGPEAQAAAPFFICPSVLVYGADQSLNVDGAYSYAGQLNSRPYYQNTTLGRWLFWMRAKEGGAGTWVVGTSPGANTGFMAIFSKALSPSDVVGWYVVRAGSWAYAAEADVSCAVPAPAFTQPSAAPSPQTPVLASKAPRWVLSSSALDTSRSFDLDNDSSCSYAAYVPSIDLEPPTGTRTWQAYCDGSWGRFALTIISVQPQPPQPPQLPSALPIHRMQQQRRNLNTDQNPSCAEWASRVPSECVVNPGYSALMLPKSVIPAPCTRHTLHREHRRAWCCACLLSTA